MFGVEEEVRGQKEAHDLQQCLAMSYQNLEGIGHLLRAKCAQHQERAHDPQAATPA